MNIFIAGGHGVGKTFLVSKLQLPAGLLAMSASKLIKEERGQATWGVEKRVVQVDENQAALAAAVRRHNAAGMRLLLDGHFVLQGADGDLKPLEADVFASLNLSGVILLEARPEVVAERIRGRDGREVDVTEIAALASAERAQASAVCGQLELMLITMPNVSEANFATAVDMLLGTGARD